MYASKSQHLAHTLDVLHGPRIPKTLPFIIASLEVRGPYSSFITIAIASHRYPVIVRIVDFFIRTLLQRIIIPWLDTYRLSSWTTHITILFRLGDITIHVSMSALAFHTGGVLPVRLKMT